MSRILAVLHGVVAVAAFGIGNAAVERPWNSPAILHLLFGLVLVISAVTLWREGRGVRWAVLMNLTVGALIALTLVLDRVSGADGPSAGLISAAVGFVVLEIATLKYTTPWTNPRSDT